MTWLWALAACALAASGDRTLLIVALGDSTTAGTPFFRSPAEAPPEGRGDAAVPYPSWMERERPGWRVFNRGVRGERTDQIAGRLPGVLAVKPRYVIILAGVNDVFQGVPPEHTREQLRRMYSLALESATRPIAASILPFDSSSRRQAARIRALNDWIQEEARRLKIAFCDLAAAAADPRDYSRLKGSPDGLHPDAGTYRAVGEEAVSCIDALEKGP